MYVPDKNRYSEMTYRRFGESGLLLPAVSLGLWQNFGGVPDDSRAARIKKNSGYEIVTSEIISKTKAR